jgi:Peptidase family M23
MKFKVTSPYGALEEFREHAHNGIDLAMPIGTDILSPINGVVDKIVDYGGENLGKGIILQTEDGRNVILGHLSDVKVKVGEHINIGQHIAESGNTGFSTGPHLHLGLKDSAGQFINPKPVADIINEASWFDTVKEFIFMPGPVTEFLKEVGFNIVQSEVFFLIPASLFIGLRIMAGRNFTTSWILPLLYAFFVTEKF